MDQIKSDSLISKKASPTYLDIQKSHQEAIDREKKYALPDEFDVNQDLDENDSMGMDRELYDAKIEAQAIHE